jgi:hypothetical protein
MSNADSKCMKGELWVTLSDAAIKKAHSKYSFEFAIHGVAYRAWYDPKTDMTYFDCGEKADALFQLTEEINRLIYEGHMEAQINIIDLHKFVCKHLRAMTKVVQELQLAPASERRYEVLNSDGISVEDWCLEELSEVTPEQKKKPN